MRLFAPNPLRVQQNQSTLICRSPWRLISLLRRNWPRFAELRSGRLTRESFSNSPCWDRLEQGTPDDFLSAANEVSGQHSSRRVASNDRLRELSKANSESGR